MAFREVIQKYLPAGTMLPPVPPALASIMIPPVTMERVGGLFDGLAPPVRADRPLSMEDLGQSYGLTLYRTAITTPGRRLLEVRDVRDYAIVYLDGKKVATLDRRHKMRSVELEVGSVPARLEILVENGGRINYGREILANRKGIDGTVTWGGTELTGWSMNALPCASAPAPSGGTGPDVYRGSFTLTTPGETYLDMRGWGKGVVWVNGHNLGRYWYIGPQQTLYLPGAWLRAGANEITVVELDETAARTVQGLPEPILAELRPDKLQPPPPKRAARAVTLRVADLVREGSFVPGDEEQERTIPATSGRYVCLESVSSLGSDPFASIAEFNLLDPDGAILPRTAWKVYAVDSEELTAEDGHAENAFDGDRSSIWHTQWGSAKPPHPHALVIDLGAETRLGGFRYLPRTGGSPGKIKDFRFYVRREPFAPAD
jgi:beta-galactosidase